MAGEETGADEVPKDLAKDLEGVAEVLALEAPKEPAGGSFATRKLAVAHRGPNTVLQLDVSVLLADGSCQPLLERGSHLPASGAVLLTTTQAAQPEVWLEVVQGARPTWELEALSSETPSHVRVCMVRAPVPEAPAGHAQVLLQVRGLASGDLEATAQDMLTGRVTKGGVPSVLARARMTPTWWPVRWQYFPRGDPAGDGPTAHPGFTFGRKFLPIKHSPIDLPEGHKDVEVDPALTSQRVWPAAYDTARFLERRGVEGARVLELGAGLGLVGLATAVCNAEHVCLTDLGENLPHLYAGAERVAMSAGHLDVGEAPTDQVRVCALDWCQVPAPGREWGESHAERKIRKLLESPWDIVVASDCVFWEELFTPLLNVLLRLTEEPNKVEVDPLAPPPSLLSDDEHEGDAGDWRPPELVLLSFVPRLARVWTFLQMAEEHFYLEDVTRHFAKGPTYYAGGSETQGPLEPRIFAIMRRPLGDEAFYIKPEVFPSVVMRSPSRGNSPLAASLGSRPASEVSKFRPVSFDLSANRS